MTDLIYYDEPISDEDYAALSQSMQYSNVFFGDYFRSLLGEAIRCGYFEKSFGEEIKKELAEALASLINEFTRGESTSVMRETADELFESVLYSLDVRLMFEGSHIKALSLIQSKDVSELYFEGQKLLERLTIECVGLLVRAKKTRIAVPDKPYSDMLDFEIRDWIFRYDKRFFAHRTRRSSVYQTSLGCGRLRGVLYTKKYLENLIAENAYLGRFDPENVSQICFDYSLSRGNEYNNTGCNIFTLIFTQQIIRAIAGKDGNEITVSSEIIRDAGRKLKKLRPDEMRLLVSECADVITEDVYAKRCVNSVFRRIEEATANNKLRALVSVSAGSK